MTMFFGYKKTPDHSGSLAANSEVMYELPLGPTYESFKFATNIESQYLTYEIELNGEVIIKWTGTQLDMLDQFHVLPKIAGIISARIALEHFKDPDNITASALVTGAGDNVYLRVKVGNTAVESLTHKVYARTSLSQAKRFVIPRIKPVAIQISQVGENEYMMKRRGRSAGAIRIAQMHLIGTANNVKIEQDGLVQLDLPKSINDAFLRQSQPQVRAPVAGVFHLDFTQGGHARDMFDTFSREQLRFDITTTDTTDIVALMHTIEADGSIAN